MGINLSAIVIAKNEEAKIGECLESLSWVDEIIVIDSGSTDKTIEIAKKYRARVVSTDTGSFSDWRNIWVKEAAGDWILYVDADERVTPLLRKEITSVADGQFTAYAIPRKNFILGQRMRWGGL